MRDVSIDNWLTKKPDRFSTTGLLSKLNPVKEQIICQKRLQPNKWLNRWC